MACFVRWDWTVDILPRSTTFELIARGRPLSLKTPLGASLAKGDTKPR